jgi:4-amino-4-deoxy-L-arabinose transferase-like glycosyltransferase
MPPSSSYRRWLLAILAVALVLRLGAAVALQYYLDRVAHRTFLIEGDASGYWELAHKIVRGESYSIYTPPRQVLRMPGFPALLAISIQFFGDNLFAARILLALVATAAVGLVAGLGRTLFGERTGLIAAGLAAASPPLIVFGVEVLTETAFAATMLLNLWAMAVYLRRLQKTELEWLAHAAWGLIIGGTTALACYMRPSWLLAAPIFAAAIVALVRPRARTAVAAVMTLLGCVAALHPWAARNHRVTGHYVQTTLWMGASLYDGLNPSATGDSEMSFYDRDNLLATMSEYEVDRWYRAAAWKFARENPGQTVELAAEKFWRYWKPWPNAPQFKTWTLRIGTALWFIPLCVTAAIGLWSIRRDLWGLLIVAGPIVYFCLLHLLFVSSLRYRLPAEYPLLAASAIGIQRMAALLRAREKGAG